MQPCHGPKRQSDLAWVVLVLIAAAEYQTKAYGSREDAGHRGEGGLASDVALVEEAAA